MDYVLALDQGTHASRALVLDDRGRVVTQNLQPVGLTRPRADRVEQDAGQLADALSTAVNTALAALRPQQRRAIRCCGLTTQRSTVLAWRADGSAVSPAINWQDTRGAAQLRALRPHQAEICRLSGLPLSAHYGASKLHWLQQALAGETGVTIGPLAGFLLERIGGGGGVDHSNAQRMQLLDIHALDWSRRLCDWFDVGMEALPPCRPVIAAHGTLSGHDIPVTAVCGDQNAAWFAAGTPPPGVARVNLGSGAFILAEQSSPLAPDGLISSIACSENRHCEYLVEGTVNGAGNALQWLRERYRIDDLDKRLAGWLTSVAEPPLFLNTVGGLGSPWWTQGPQPCFLTPGGDALGAAPDPAAAAAAVGESILFLLQHNIERIQARQALRLLRVSGGLSRVTPLCRKLASLSGLPVEQVSAAEASARGIAWLAAGRPADWHSAPGRRFEPMPDSALKTRYHACIEQLQRHIDNNNAAPADT
jgi:glycerol kinase